MSYFVYILNIPRHQNTKNGEHKMNCGSTPLLDGKIADLSYPSYDGRLAGALVRKWPGGTGTAQFFFAPAQYACGKFGKRFESLEVVIREVPGGTADRRAEEKGRVRARLGYFESRSP